MPSQEEKRKRLVEQLKYLLREALEAPLDMLSRGQARELAEVLEESFEAIDDEHDDG